MMATVLQVFLGIVGLSLIVLIHEAGHYITARLVKIRVETFSIGFGRRLFGFRRGETDYRVSLVPLGGYCRFYGEDSFREAVDQKLDSIPAREGDFYAAGPWKRIAVGVSGPLANVIFAFLIYAAILGIGYNENYWEPRIILFSEVAGDGIKRPADIGGLESGDRIISINGKSLSRYSQLSDYIALAPDKELTFLVDRDGRRRELTIVPRLDKDAGYATIGVYVWLEPVIYELEKGSAAEQAGLMIGDRIEAVNGRKINHQSDFYAAIDSPETSVLEIKVRRNGSTRMVNLDTRRLEVNGFTGITFPYKTGRSENLNLFQAIGRGAVRTADTFGDILRGLRMLFMGISLQNAVTGPAGIVFHTGEVIQSSFSMGFGPGMLWTFRFLAFISVSLAFMNLLPIPVMDGGQILLFFVEIVQRHPVRPGSVYRYQFVGTIIVLLIFVAASAGDIMRFVSHINGG